MSQLDHKYYPHIVDHILAYASDSALLAFRATSKAFHAKADSALFRHVAVDHWDRQYRPTLVAPGGGSRLPIRWQDENATEDERARWLARLRQHTEVVDYCRSFNAYVYDPQLASALSSPPPLSTALKMVRRIHADSVMDTFLPVLLARTAVDFVALTPLQLDGKALPANTSVFPSLAHKWVINLVFDPAQASQAVALNFTNAKHMERTREFVITFTALSSAGITPAWSLLDGPVGRGIRAIRPYLPAARVTFVDAHTLDRKHLGLDTATSDAGVANAIIDAIVDIEGYPQQDEDALRAAVSIVSSAEYAASVGMDAELELGVESALKQRAGILHAPEEVRSRSRQTIKNQKRCRSRVARVPIERVVSPLAEDSALSQVLKLALPHVDRATLFSLRRASKSLLHAADVQLFSHVVAEVADVDPYLGPSLRVRSLHGRLPGFCWEDPNATPDERERWTQQLSHAKTVDYPDRIHEVYDRALWSALSGADTARRVDCLSAVGGKNVVDYVDWSKAAPDTAPKGTVGAVSTSCKSLTIIIRYDPRHPLLNQARLHLHLSRGPGVRNVTYIFEACTTAELEPSHAHAHAHALEPQPFSMLKDLTAHIVSQGLNERSTFIGLSDIPREVLELPPCTNSDTLVDAFRETVLVKWHERVSHLNPTHKDYCKPFPDELTSSMTFLSPAEAGITTQWPAGVGAGRSMGDPPIFGSLTPYL